MARGTPTARLLAVGLAAAFIVAAWIGVAAPWLERIEGDRQRLDRQHALIVGFERTAARADEARARLERLNADLRTSRLWLTADSLGQAAAALQELVKSAAAAAGAELISAQAVGQDSTASGRLGLRAVLAADMTSLQAVLHALETAEPVTVVEALVIRPRQLGSARVLDVQLDVVGFTRNVP